MRCPWRCQRRRRSSARRHCWRRRCRIRFRGGDRGRRVQTGCPALRASAGRDFGYLEFELVKATAAASAPYLERCKVGERCGDYQDLVGTVMLQLRDCVAQGARAYPGASGHRHSCVIDARWRPSKRMTSPDCSKGRGRCCSILGVIELIANCVGPSISA